MKYYAVMFNNKIVTIGSFTLNQCLIFESKNEAEYFVNSIAPSKTEYEVKPIKIKIG